MRNSTFQAERRISHRRSPKRNSREISRKSGDWSTKERAGNAGERGREVRDRLKSIRGTWHRDISRHCVCGPQAWKTQERPAGLQVKTGEHRRPKTAWSPARERDTRASGREGPEDRVNFPLRMGKSRLCSTSGGKGPVKEVKKKDFQHYKVPEKVGRMDPDTG